VTPPVFHRYVAIGDSFTEGVGDRDASRPNGVRGWADRVAEVLATRADDFGYANLAVRGRTLRPILAQQIEPAVALAPDLITIYAGGNDLIRPRCDVDALAEPYDEAIGTLAATGATVGLFTAFDPGGGGPFARLRGRFAVYNERVREIADRHG
jgi:lysophospholipase L1-like esterase